MNKYEKVVNNVPINCIITVYAKLTTDEGKSAVVKSTRVIREEITRDYLGKVMGSIVNSYEKDLGHIISYEYVGKEDFEKDGKRYTMLIDSELGEYLNIDIYGYVKMNYVMIFSDDSVASGSAEFDFQNEILQKSFDSLLTLVMNYYYEKYNKDVIRCGFISDSDYHKISKDDSGECFSWDNGGDIKVTTL